jgi:signal transduction histidine kinase
MGAMENSYDPVHEPRLGMRLVLLGIVAAVLALFPVYGLLLGLTLTGTVFVVAPGGLAGLSAIVGIEMALRWEYRMRRRHTYPHELGCELAPIYQFEGACRRAAKLVAHWLRARAVVVGWLTEDGQLLEPVAVYGLPAGWLKRAPSVSLGDGPLSETLRRGKLLTRQSTAGDSWFTGGTKRERAVYVPLVARGRLEGVLALAAAGGNVQVRDQRLLAALGVVLGLALDNCRLYEGQRAHAQHLHQLNRMKSDFLSTVSHELRTPLTSIMMAAEMLLEEEETRDPQSTRGKLVANIVRGASRLSSLVADLVNISRDDEFKPRLELDSVSIDDLVANAAAIVQPLVAAKHQTIDLKSKAPGTVVRVDRLRFEQVLINLLSNAQRYTPPGGHITVSSRVARAEVILTVADSGPGVNPEDRDLIFEPFYRGDRSGLGLGLAIAKSLVELHNGRIWVNDSDRNGSEFCVALAVQAPAGARALVPSATR